MVPNSIKEQTNRFCFTAESSSLRSKNILVPILHLKTHLRFKRRRKAECNTDGDLTSNKSNREDHSRSLLNNMSADSTIQCEDTLQEKQSEKNLGDYETFPCHTPTMELTSTTVRIASILLEEGLVDRATGDNSDISTHIGTEEILNPDTVSTSALKLDTSDHLTNESVSLEPVGSIPNH
jgi:hypothetical protein